MAFIQQIIQELCSPVILVAFLTLLFLFLIKQYERYRKLPPGPLGIPFIGQLNSIKKEFHLFLYDLCKNFGKITCFKMGVETIVVISDHKLIKKAFRSRDFTARPKSELTKLMGGYGKKFFVVYDYFCFRIRVVLPTLLVFEFVKFLSYWCGSLTNLEKLKLSFFPKTTRHMSECI